ncbi:MAG: [LysW]-aminoadipate kinase [Candidatus Peregrinibacteria bacterium]|nr:[LysW]-aminoadipate kinase [Candidatus Peregrinibacteria bacterium]MDZ4244526.1 [LysW]-aminoadipate kinase [Candidatus Gracilibacteria bacterium]
MLIVKVGGPSQGEIENVLKDFAAYSGPKILLHGASNFRDQLAVDLGKPVKHVTSPTGIESVRTDSDAIDIFMMSYPGFMNSRIVERLQQLGCNAVGLSGLDGRLFRGERKNAIRSKVVDEDDREKVVMVRDDLSGRVSEINKELLDLVMSGGYVPVLSLPFLSFGSDDELPQACNSDNDSVAALLAKTYEAEVLLYLSNTRGLYTDFPNEDSFISEVRYDQIDEALESWAKRRMKRKVLGAREAIEYGVKKVVFADMRVDEPIKKALEGEGTIFTK